MCSPPGTSWAASGPAEVLVIAGRTAEVRFSYEGERPLLTAAAPALSEPSPAPAAPAPAASPEPAPAPPPDGRCHIASEGSVMARACRGGIAAAKSAMKNVVLLGRQRGARVDCASCHADDTSFALLPVARERLGQLLTFLDAVPVDPRGAAPAGRKRRGR
jgi:hypothetical protein